MANIPDQMTVIEIAAPGGPEQLKLARRPTPKPGEGEVLVRVAAAGVNRPDVMQRQGKYPPPPGASDIPGLEIAGEVVALGAEVAASRSATKSRRSCPAGDMPNMRVAAAPLVSAGAEDAEHGRSGRDTGDLLHRLDQPVRPRRLQGGGRRARSTAARAASAPPPSSSPPHGARGVCNRRQPEKARACERLGAARGIDYTTEDFVEVVRGGPAAGAWT